jgi:hypothetical protein
MASERSDLHAEIVRSMLDHESDVINHRITWMGTFQGLLFAGLAFFWDKAGTRWLMLVFCALGIAISSIMSVALFKASLATRDLLKWWSEKGPKDYDGPPIIGQTFDSRAQFFILFPAWNFIPFCFILAWSSVLYIKFCA